MIKNEKKLNKNIDVLKQKWLIWDRVKFKKDSRKEWIIQVILNYYNGKQESILTLTTLKSSSKIPWIYLENYSNMVEPFRGKALQTN